MTPLVSMELQKKEEAESHTDVDILNPLVAQDFPHLASKLNTHVLATPVNRQPVNVAVRPSKVDVLKDVGGVRPLLDDLAEARGAALLNEDGLAGKDVHDVGKAELRQRDGLGREEVVHSAGEGVGWARPEAQRPDAVGVPEECKR